MRYKYRKPSPIKKYRPLIAVVGIAIIISVVALSIQKDLSQLPEEPEPRAIAIAEMEQTVMAFKRAYPDAISNVMVLEPEAAKEKAEKYPVIYGDLPEKTLYEVYYSAEETGIFLVIDIESGQVLKIFETAFQLL